MECVRRSLTGHQYVESSAWVIVAALVLAIAVNGCASVAAFDAPTEVGDAEETAVSDDGALATLTAEVLDE